ncbi:hypothetical protein FDF08_09760 [Micrococcus luteus]|nr:hypothetical protein FDF08_09760 [Micrococcus luteus]
MSGFATVQDLEERWPGITTGAVTRAETLIEDAELLIEGDYPAVGEWVASGLLRADVVTFVVCRMVKRALGPDADDAPGGQFESMSRTTGPFLTTLNFREPAGDGEELFLRRAERNLLTAHLRARARAGRAFTIQPGAGR